MDRSTGFNGTHPALGIVNMMHQEGFDIPILAYTTKVGVSVEYPGELVVFNSENQGGVLENIDDYQVLYHYKIIYYLSMVSRQLNCYSRM